MLIFHLKLWDRSGRCSCVAVICGTFKCRPSLGSLWIWCFLFVGIFRMCSRFSQCSAVFFFAHSVCTRHSRSNALARICVSNGNSVKRNQHWVCKNMQIHIISAFHNVFFFCFSSSFFRFLYQFAMQERKSQVICSEWQQRDATEQRNCGKVMMRAC